jgi:hypothetical protein
MRRLVLAKAYRVWSIHLAVLRHIKLFIEQKKVTMAAHSILLWRESVVERKRADARAWAARPWARQWASRRRSMSV